MLLLFSGFCGKAFKGQGELKEEVRKRAAECSGAVASEATVQSKFFILLNI